MSFRIQESDNSQRESHQFSRSRIFYLLGFFIPFLLSMVILCFYAKNRLFQHNVFPQSDLAADMLLVNKFDSQGYLLTGQYSRYKFYHPGPFFFYVHRIFEKLFSSTLPTRSAAWMLSMIFLNSIFLTIASCTAFTSSSKIQITIIKRVAFIIISLFYLKFYALSTWPPDKIMIPFMAFLLTLPHIAQRKFAWIPLSVFLASVLFHGRVDSPIFTFPLLLFAIGWGIFRYRGSLKKKEIGFVSIGAGIGFFFLLPLIIDSILNTPSNLHLILTSTHRLSIAASSWHDVFSYLWGYLTENKSLFLFLIIQFVIIKLNLMSSSRLFMKDLLIFCMIETTIFLIYFKIAPPPLSFYMGEFFLVIPLLIFIYPIINQIGSLPHHTVSEKSLIYYSNMGVNIIITGVLIALVAEIFREPSPPYNEDSTIQQLAQEIIKMMPPDHDIRLGHDPDLWPIVAGLLLELNKEKYKVCSILFTPSDTCSPNVHPNIILLTKKECAIRKCQKIIGEYGLEKYSSFIKISLGKTLFLSSNITSSPYLFRGWAGGENWGRWSVGKEAIMDFEVSPIPQEPVVLKMNINAFVTISHPVQEVRIYANSEFLADLHFKYNQRGGVFRQITIPLPQKTWKNGGRLTLRFKTPNAISPMELHMSQDSRALGLGMTTLRIEKQSTPSLFHPVIRIGGHDRVKVSQLKGSSEGFVG